MQSQLVIDSVIDKIAELLISEAMNVKFLLVE